MRVGVFASGRGSNFQTLVDAKARGALPKAEIAMMLTNDPDADVIERARKAGVEAVVVPHRGLKREEHEERVAAEVNARGVELIVLAGYMRILSPHFFELVKARIVNTHPALLPLFGGKGMYGEHVHEAVLRSGMRFSGVSVHFVTPEVDAGPIILQKVVAVMPSDDLASLAARVLEAEHRVLPYVVKLISEGRVLSKNGRVEISNYAEVIRDLELV